MAESISDIGLAMFSGSSMIDSNTKLVRKSDLLSTEVDGETVMLDIESGHYFTLTSGVGTHIWSSLEASRSVEAVVEDVKNSFAVENEDEAGSEIFDFLQKMVDRGLVEVTSS